MRLCLLICNILKFILGVLEIKCRITENQMKSAVGEKGLHYITHILMLQLSNVSLCKLSCIIKHEGLIFCISCV